MVRKAIILCSGVSTRFLPISKSVCKEMLPILNRPVIDYTIQDLKNNGITDILIILDRNKEIIENYYDRNIELENTLEMKGKQKELEEICNMYKDVNITFMRQIYGKGSGFNISKARNFVGDETFVLLFPDELIWGDSCVRQMLEVYENTETSVIPLRKVDIKDSYKYEMVDVQENELGLKISNFIENPDPQDTPSDLSYIGGGVFTANVFNCLENSLEHKRGEVDIVDSFYGLMRIDDLYGCVVSGERIDVGTSLRLIKGNIIAGLSDSRYREELLEFIKDIVNGES